MQRKEFAVGLIAEPGAFEFLEAQARINGGGRVAGVGARKIGYGAF